MVFSDAICEGDWRRILWCWQYLLLIFTLLATKEILCRSFEAIGSILFFFLHNTSLSNQYGQDASIFMVFLEKKTCDLFLEHLNRICNQAVETLGSNFSVKALERVGCCVGIFDGLSDQFDRDLLTAEILGSHSIASLDNDKSIIIKQLIEAEVFSFHRNRVHASFKAVKINIVSLLMHDKFHKWMRQQLFAIEIKSS